MDEGLTYPLIRAIYIKYTRRLRAGDAYTTYTLNLCLGLYLPKLAGLTFCSALTPPHYTDGLFLAASGEKYCLSKAERINRDVTLFRTAATDLHMQSFRLPSCLALQGC